MEGGDEGKVAEVEEVVGWEGLIRGGLWGGGGEGGGFDGDGEGPLANSDGIIP